MAEGYSKLLMYIVENLLMPSESRESQIEATANRDVEGEIAGEASDLRADAQRLAPYFSEGLRRAIAGGGRVVVDDRDPQGNGIADAFARFLVTANIATSESSEISDGHYRYKFDVDLAKVRDIAQKAGVELA